MHYASTWWGVSIINFNLPIPLDRKCPMMLHFRVSSVNNLSEMTNRIGQNQPTWPVLKRIDLPGYYLLLCAPTHTDTKFKGFGRNFLSNAMCCEPLGITIALNSSPFLLRDADMHSAYLLRRRGWVAGCPSHTGIVSKRLIFLKTSSTIW